MATQPLSVPEGLLSVNQSAELCGVHRNTIRNWILEGKLPAIRIGSRILRVNAADLAALATPYQGVNSTLWNRA
jgi:excisionase family DNA binding protein